MTNTTQPTGGLLKLGLTGGIGCGKSTALRIFGELGWRTVQTDGLARDVLENEPEVREALLARWGERVFGGDGKPDRKSIAEIVFGSSAELEWLESVLHPRVRQAWLSEMERFTEGRHLVEIPLLFEKNLESHFDFVVCVSCSETVTALRMRERGFSEADLRKRRDRQLPLEEKRERADFVLSNCGTLEFLELQIRRLSEQLER